MVDCETFERRPQTAGLNVLSLMVHNCGMSAYEIYGISKDGSRFGCAGFESDADAWEVVA
jgi:hypothetical protein